MSKFNATSWGLVLVVSALSLAGCQVDGCTDADAVNYDPTADNFDGSCEYEGQIVLWYGAAASAELVDWDSASLNFYVDGQIVGSTATTQYWTGAPACGDNASITITKDMGKSTALAATYEVLDDWGDTWWSGVLNFEANTCLQLELTL